MADNVRMGVTSGSDATYELRDTILKLAEANSQQTIVMIRPTWCITILTVVMTIAVIAQIAIAVWS